jgi:hypothetical protein
MNLLKKTRLFPATALKKIQHRHEHIFGECTRTANLVNRGIDVSLRENEEKLTY